MGAASSSETVQPVIQNQIVSDPVICRISADRQKCLYAKGSEQSDLTPIHLMGDIGIVIPNGTKVMIDGEVRYVGYSGEITMSQSEPIKFVQGCVEPRYVISPGVQIPCIVSAYYVHPTAEHCHIILPKGTVVRYSSGVAYSLESETPAQICFDNTDECQSSVTHDELLHLATNPNFIIAAQDELFDLAINSNIINTTPDDHCSEEQVDILNE